MSEQHDVIKAGPYQYGDLRPPNIAVGIEHTVGQLVTQVGLAASLLQRGLIDGRAPGEPRLMNTVLYRAFNAESNDVYVMRTSRAFSADKAHAHALGIPVRRGIEDILRLGNLGTRDGPYQHLTLATKSYELLAQPDGHRPKIPMEYSLSCWKNTVGGHDMVDMAFGWKAQPASLKTTDWQGHFAVSAQSLELGEATKSSSVSCLHEQFNPDLIDQISETMRIAQEFCSDEDSLVANIDSYVRASRTKAIARDPHTYTVRRNTVSRIIDWCRDSARLDFQEKLTPEAIINGA